MGVQPPKPRLSPPQPHEVLGRIEENLQVEDVAANPVSIGLVDVDMFGEFNRKHGAEAGDALLVRLFEVLESAGDERGRVMRFGGDAFVLVFVGVAKEQAFLRVEKAREQFAALAPAEFGTTAGATLSAGVAGAPDDATVAPLLIRKATDALYRAKVSGRDKVCLAREEKMVTKTTHYSQGQLEGLSRLSKRMGVSEAELLREGLDDLFRKHNR